MGRFSSRSYLEHNDFKAFMLPVIDLLFATLRATKGWERNGIYTRRRVVIEGLSRLQSEQMEQLILTKVDTCELIDEKGQLASFC